MYILEHVCHIYSLILKEIPLQMIYFGSLVTIDCNIYSLLQFSPIIQPDKQETLRQNIPKHSTTSSHNQ